eukprot:Skav220306  [mRNA]  locus=scaffold525:8399:19452:+ [translate_table: standard]
MVASVRPWGRSGNAGMDQEHTNAVREKLMKDVEDKLLQAKRENERKVATELKFLQNAMHEMDARLDLLNRRLEDAQMQQKPETVDATSVGQALAKVEQHWGKELNGVKAELHQMIFAHNHNADLIKIQKDTLDKIRGEASRGDPGSPACREKISRARAVLVSADARVKAAQAMHQTAESLATRVECLEMQMWHPSRTAPSAPPTVSAPGAYGFEPDRSVPSPPDYEATVASPDDGEDEEEDSKDDDWSTALGGILTKARVAGSAAE